MNISEQELEIFSRHLILKEFDEAAFKKLQKKKITLIGLGGIGCPAIQYLVSTGVKNIKLIDGDIVQKNNLNRQLLFSINDIKKSKAVVAKERLKNINPECNIDIERYNINSKNINDALNNSSLIIDTTDNWKTMILINRYCVKRSIPLISSSAIGFDGQVILFKNKPKNHLCLQCIFPTNKEPDISRCDSVGIAGIAAGMTGLVTAQKALNFLTNYKDDNYITMINAKSLKITNLMIEKNKKCRVF
ncbi:MAG: Sulfur carrier protein ThiS adenylyltransferase [Alphaproteobacteria bacterium MarineAlpha5_Bin8]|nr:MAG: Sulfur carrier protein ThiS adenylyltransferase [Alphaproteobacteria bacterium MarineAlpha5_Bin7]PPR48205.1 MAG: Sulfur carrier protein ThiS adenylyltransferase [Alphaproteobacteria bacterium MarineAlpha5_Bin8]|tara:strand:- start:2676 stop:3416 length:741 start_codon:yes stop_codon:yes gene_type:complete